MDKEVEGKIYNIIIEKANSLRRDQLEYIKLCLNRCGGEIKLEYEKDQDKFPMGDFETFEDQFPNQVNVDGLNEKFTILLTRIKMERMSNGEEVIGVYGLCSEDMEMVEYRTDLFFDMFDSVCDFIHMEYGKGKNNSFEC